MAILTNKQMVGNVNILWKRSILLISLLFYLVCIKAQPEYASNADVPHEAYTKRTSLKKLIKQAHKGDIDAQFQLGHDYYWGLATKDGLRDFKTARMWLAMAAANGHGESLAYLGRIYKYGRGVKRDLAMAQSYYNQSKENGFNEAYYDLGLMLIEEGYPQKDIQKGLDYILQAAEGGSPLAQMNMSKYYLFGDYLKKDFKKSLYWAEQGLKNGSKKCYGIAGYICIEHLAADNNADQKGVEYIKKGASIGDDFSQYCLAHLYNLGICGIEKDSLKCIYWLRQSADNDNMQSQYELGNLLYEGGVSRNDSLEALKYIMKSADNGNDKAQNLLGCMYHNGYQMPADQEKAYNWFNKSASQGNMVALKNVGLYYANGWGGIKRDIYMAYKYYGEALQLGADNVDSNISKLVQKGSKDAQEKYSKGVKLYNDIVNKKVDRSSMNINLMFDLLKQSAEEGNAYAQYEVGMKYRDGIGVPKDTKEAFNWFKKAVDNGNTTAICPLAYMYYKGEATPQNHDMAFYLYHLDAMMGDKTDQFNTALYYNYGWGNIKKDINKAKEWLKKSADQGYEKAIKMLKELEESNGTIKSSDIIIDEGNETKKSNSMKRIALVVGNQKYKSNPLRNAVNDAEALKRKLSLLGFDDIRILRNATKFSLDTCVTNFAYDASKYDAAVFFYSGHGVQIDNENYLLPVDVNLDSDRYAADMCTKLSDIFNKMEKSGCPIKIVMIDACRSNPFKSQTKTKGKIRGFADISYIPDEMFISFSAMPGQLASDGLPGDKNSPYIRAILEVLGQPSLDVDQVFKKVGSLVEQYTGHNQKPHRQATLNNHEFYFNTSEIVYSK